LGAIANGQTFRFQPPGAPTQLPALSGVTLEDIHGLTPNDLMVVGHTAAGAPFVARYNGAQWNDQAGLLPQGLPNATLHAVFMVSARLAFAVGDGGLVLQLRDGVWSQLGGAPNVSFNGVVAFGTNALYTVDGSTIRRHTAAGWATLVTLGGNVVLRDIAATSPSDIWAVGSGGAVVHWHEP
jgi:hypothetical protein